MVNSIQIPAASERKSVRRFLRYVRPSAIQLGGGPASSHDKEPTMRWMLCVFAAVALWTMAVLPASIVQAKPAYNCTGGTFPICQCDNETGCKEMEKKECSGGPTRCTTVDGKQKCQCDKALVKNPTTRPQRVPAASRGQ
jgi:hypothetical protein